MVVTDGRDEIRWLGWEEWEEEWLRQGWRNEAGSWFQREGDACCNERFVSFFMHEDNGGREMVTTDEGRVSIATSDWTEIKLRR